MYHAYADALRASFLPMIPEMILVVFACILFLGGTHHGSRRLWSSIALLGLATSLAALILTWRLPMIAEKVSLLDRNLYGVPFLFDSLSSYTRVLAIVGGAMIVLMSWREVHSRQSADHHACLLLIVAGTGLVGAANDLVAMFLVLELISIPTYILLYLPRHDVPAQEAAVKYFLLSILSSALLLFGFSYLYGLTGTTNLSGIHQVFLRHRFSGDQQMVPLAGMASIAMIMIVAALGFRITAVPFHFYAPDVYQGTSTSGAAMLAFIPKIAGFGALLRLLGFVLSPTLLDEIRQMQPLPDFHPGMILSDHASILLWFLAIFTMTIGNVFGLLQDNVKRLLAYSSVAHAGYMLVALASAPHLADNGNLNGTAPLLFYLVAYGAMTIGTFTVLSMLSTTERRVETIDDLAGLAQSHPGTSLMLVVLLSSLIGIPLTAGFTGKLFVFLSAVEVDRSPVIAWLFKILALVGFINAAIGGWYYLRLIAVMYLRSSIKPVTNPGNLQGRLVLASCVLLTLSLSFPPLSGWVLDLARKATPSQVRRDQGQKLAIRD